MPPIFSNLQKSWSKGRVGNNNSVILFLLVTIVSQLVKTPPPLTEGVWHITAFSSFTSMSFKRKELFRKHGIEIPKLGDTQCFNHSLTVGVIFENCFAIYS